MADNMKVRLLEMTVISSGRTWEWRIQSGQDLLVRGVEPNRMAARFASYDAIFQLLASGWH